MIKSSLGARALSVILGSLLVLALTPGDALAYLDPGSGSFVFQILISALLGAVVLFRTSWRRLLDFLFPSRRRRNGPHDDA